MGKDPKVAKGGTLPVINSKSSYPFISLINCPCLLFIVNFGLLNSFVGCIEFGFFYIPRYWVRDVTREYTKYEVYIIMLPISCLVFVFF